MRHLIIPDLHQDVRFLDRILKEQPWRGLDSVVFLGDLFDAKDPANKGPETLSLLLTRIADMAGVLGPRLKIMLGNHDVLYYYGRGPTQGYDALTGYYGPANPELMKVAKTALWDVLRARFEICSLIDQVLLSHAGFTSDFWDHAMTTEDNVRRINQSMHCLTDNSGQLCPLFKAGFIRGGDMDRGGPLWLDFDHEFEDELPLPQVVGHTVGNQWRSKGRSYCLDARQRCYGILDEAGLSPIWCGPD